MWASICKIAFRTIPRCGITAMILICVGLYTLFPACKDFQEIQVDKHTNYELNASTNSSSLNLNTLIQLDGIEKITPVLSLNASLSIKDHVLNSEVLAVHSSFLQLDFTEGGMYPENSNMPYLILNEAAAESFKKEYKTMTVCSGDTIQMDAGGLFRKAIVCGIFDDGTESPTIYMSYDVAHKEHGTGGHTDFIIVLENKGSAESVISSLQKKGIYANFDSNITLAWNLRSKQCWQTVLLSVVLLACAGMLIRWKRKEEIVVCRSESSMLLISGMTASVLRKLYPVRLGMAQLVCMLAASTVAVIMGTFSPLGTVTGLCAMIVLHIAVVGVYAAGK